MTAKPVLTFTLIAAAIALMAVTLLPVPSSAETILKVGGTGSALGTMRQLAAAYEKTQPGIKIKVMPSLGSTAGIKAALAGAIDLGLASRPLKDNERQQGAHAVEYARTPLTFITSPSVIKKNLTTRELEEIYTRSDARWPDGKTIRLILRPEQDTDTLLISNVSPAMPQAMKAAHARPGMTVAITDQEATEAVSRISNSFGTAALSEILSDKIPVNVLSFNGVQPTVKGLADKSYPLLKSIFIVTSPKTSAEARGFAAFVTSPAAAGILQSNGNLPVKAK
jgi:phosphate transport system substrate-binding protein